jgi:hypothetical protein
LVWNSQEGLFKDRFLREKRASANRWFALAFTVFPKFLTFLAEELLNVVYGM